MTTTDTLAGRAAEALGRARRQDPGFDSRPCDVQRAITRRRLVRDVTDVFAVACEAVTVTDDPDREHGGWRWYRVTIADDGTEYRFTSFAGTVDALRALAPCPECAGEVPAGEAPDLATLGRVLDARTNGHPVPAPPGFGSDVGHQPVCPLRENS
ncbi:hypothetical protein [Amycolatopsis magusensis]|uniref:Uncharacterized protein n=1 Tax=Amycolatopsis magusensis TaxID=882444 RepID=A0ABS4PTZ4_9PSEU|nr:hypothetical protein [Amycolatopsis magusensis]MBP2182899.1 hypothetical protein [Amycolatopsis magusensis]